LAPVERKAHRTIRAELPPVRVPDVARAERHPSRHAPAWYRTMNPPMSWRFAVRRLQSVFRSLNEAISVPPTWGDSPHLDGYPFHPYYRRPRRR
jgi:hypothetical protein